MSSWAPSSWTWAESGTPFLGSRVTCLQGFQTEHESSSGTKARHADVGTNSSAASSATALMVCRGTRACPQPHPCPTAVWPTSPPSRPCFPKPPGGPLPALMLSVCNYSLNPEPQLPNPGAYASTGRGQQAPASDPCASAGARKGHWDRASAPGAASSGEGLQPASLCAGHHSPAE